MEIIKRNIKATTVAAAAGESGGAEGEGGG